VGRRRRSPLACTKRKPTKNHHKRSNLKSSIKYIERPTQRVLLHIYMGNSLSLSLSYSLSLSLTHTLSFSLSPLSFFSSNHSPRRTSPLSSPLTASKSFKSSVSLHPRHRCPKEKYLPSALMLLRVLLEGEKVPSEPLTRRELRLAGSCDSQTGLVRCCSHLSLPPSPSDPRPLSSVVRGKSEAAPHLCLLHGRIFQAQKPWATDARQFGAGANKRVV
jgi:hypothetical protein